MFGDSAGDTIREPTSGELSAIATSLGVGNGGGGGTSALVQLSEVASLDGAAAANFVASLAQGYERFLFIGKHIRPTNGNDSVNLRISGDGGSTYFASGYNWVHQGTNASGVGVPHKNSTTADASFMRVLPSMGSATSQASTFWLWTGSTVKTNRRWTTMS